MDGNPRKPSIYQTRSKKEATMIKPKRRVGRPPKRKRIFKKMFEEVKVGLQSTLVDNIFLRRVEFSLNQV